MSVKQHVTHDAILSFETNIIHIVKLETGYMVENQRGPDAPYATLKTVRHAVIDTDDAFKLARELMDAPSEEEE